MVMTRATFEWPDWLALTLYFIMVIGVGFVAAFRSNRASSSGYFLAGRSSTWLIIGASTFATNVGAPMFIGLAGSAASSGIAVTMYEWHAMFMLVALGWFFLPVYRASGCSTMPQYLRLRYGRHRISMLISCIFLINTMVGNISGQMYAGALFITEIFDWNIYAAVGVILIITAAYTIVGGLTAVLWTDAMQTIVLVIGSIILSIIALIEVGGYESLKELYLASASNTTLYQQATWGNGSCGMPTQDAFHIFRSADDGSYPWPGMIGGLTILATNAWCTDQICVQRSLSAKSVSHAKGGVLLAAYLKISAFLFFVIPGMVSRILYPNEIACASAAECLAACNSASGCSNVAYPRLVMRILPTGMKGIMMAALLSALMSSLTSFFNSTSTVFTLDVYKNFRPRAHENELMIVGRVFALFMTGVSVAWLPILQAVQGSNFWNYTQSIYAHMLPPIVMAYLIGLFWKRGTEKGAFWSIIICTAIGFSRLILTWLKPKPGCGEEVDSNWDIVYKVHFLNFAMISAGLSTFLHVVISLCTMPRTPAKLRRVTFWTRHTVEPQQMSEDEWEDVQEAMGGNEKKENKDSSKLTVFCKKYICGQENTHAKPLSREEYTEQQKQMSDIKENPFIRKVLLCNAVLCVAVAVFLHAFWA